MADSTVVSIADIRVPQRHRTINFTTVECLAKSIVEVGLMNPIDITGDRVLIAGAHRLEAYKALGRTTIAANIHKVEPLRAELMEIDENLQRAELTALERATHHARAKEIYEALHPETKKGGDQGNQYTKREGRRNDNMSFRQRGKSDETEPPNSAANPKPTRARDAYTRERAKQTGKNPRTIQRDIRIGEKLKDYVPALSETPIANNQRELLKLSNVPDDIRGDVVVQLTRGNARDVKTALEQTGMTEKVQVETPAGNQDIITLATWAKLENKTRATILARRRAPKQGMYVHSGDIIEFARWSWNPITACRYNFPYCEARGRASDFCEQSFIPSLIPAQLGVPAAFPVPARIAHDTSSRCVFVCSTIDVFGKCVPKPWIRAVLQVVTENPQWNFLFVSRSPKRLAEFTFPPNAWVGTIVDCQARVKAAETAFRKTHATIKWLLCEPLLEPLEFTDLSIVDWLVIGGRSETKELPAWYPPCEWVEALVAAAEAANCKVWEKTNLFQRRLEYPNVGVTQPTLEASFKDLPSMRP